MSLDPETLARYSADFDAMCRERHEMGMEKYGPVKFLEIDTIQMALEEIADLANYSRYLYIKLRILADGAGQPTILGIEGWKKG